MLNKKTYREAIDQLSFSADFEERTMQLLRQRTREAEKENTTMKFHSLRKLAITAAVVAALALSVSAALYFLSPADVADHYDQPLLAEAFQSEKAILLDETVQTGDYDVTLAGLVSGAGLTSWEANVDTSHTYAVLMVRRTDGQSIDKEELGITEYTATPLVGSPSGGKQLDSRRLCHQLCSGRRPLLPAGHGGSEYFCQSHGVLRLL